MGEAFLDMFAVDPNPTGAFLDFVKGILAAQKVSGAEEAPLPPKKRKRATTSSQLSLERCREDLGGVTRVPGGKDVDHLHAVREKLKYALFKASHGVWRKGWPGKDTQQKLAKLKIVLCVQPNALSVTPTDFCGRSASISQGNAERLHTAIENGWVELRGPPVVDTVQNLGDTSEDQTETQTNESNRLRVPVGAMPPSVTIKAKKKRQPKGPSSRISTSTTTSQEKNPSSSSKSNTKAIQNKKTNVKSKSDARQGVGSKKNKKRKTRLSNDDSESAVSSGTSDDDGDVEEELMRNYQDEDRDDDQDDQDEHDDQDNQGRD
ncbi:uncharacterized protein PGTG_18589 [Puccinia graminis f. sp. tritici CRL 75-36-700-3]|uniref:Uncharacterized protein n=1 Tax=Puccinia graminis f. sp. tritici (strain CRL 75-36-700-3 / race SCCL) TaxID=418459 RepID=E3L8D5_PUCGT|nr:uncharacterized protein PGTG_18589 [Puccinia graminis f. sp. tritici CRL 75-36-700-3]EFP92810.2 hypothetical protein PGTG_18589 [Puccinia graminis f. sp. tritici CRL 75-36-700-3]